MIKWPMAHISLLLALLSSVSIALLLKTADRSGRNSRVVIAANYPAAMILGLIFGGDIRLSAEVLLLAVLLGFLFLAAFVCYGRAIAREGVTASVTMGRMSLAVPAGMSVLVWGETPKLIHWPALGLIFGILFFWEGKGKRVSWLLLSLFFLFGVIDTGMKFIKSSFPEVNDGSFLTVLFASAGFWAWLLLRTQRVKPRGSDVWFGVLLGVPNFFSTYFLLAALEVLPGYLVFPFVNVGAVLLAFIAGIWLFGEKIGSRKLILLILGVLAVFLLTV